MTFPKSDKIWMNGKFVPWDDAKIHVASHVVHYGSAVFEGVRCYNTPEGPAIFRLDAHGKIVEHWDVLAQLSATSANGNPEV